MEDNLADVGLIREALQGHSVRGELLVIDDGEKAVRFIETMAARSPCPDLIIVDLNLPRRSGREVLEALRNSPGCQGVLAVVLSSSDIPSDRDTSLELGARRYIQKPMLLDDFLRLGAVFRELLETAASPR